MIRPAIRDATRAALPLAGMGGGSVFALALEIESVWYAIGIEIGGTVYMLAV